MSSSNCVSKSASCLFFPLAFRLGDLAVMLGPMILSTISRVVMFTFSLFAPVIGVCGEDVMFQRSFSRDASVVGCEKLLLAESG